MRTAIIAVVLVAWASTAHAWGERGHDLVARVAARIVASRLPNDTLGKVLVTKENMLGHLANVPDIVWRSGDKAVADANGPTHFVNWDKLVPTPTLGTVPRAYAAAAKMAKELGLDPVRDIGTAPWRVEQLANGMQAAFQKGDVDGALLYGGILAHFVGDLAQPYHITKDYDGWETGEGGIHAYFESDVIQALPMTFDASVLDYALKKQPAKAIIVKADAGNNALAIAIAESMDALSFLPDVRALDTKYALVGKSTGGKNDQGRKPALRKAPEAVAQFFESRLRERLATAADVLATVWINAWEQAGKPDLGKYHSYVYPVAPTFIAPSYITP